MKTNSRSKNGVRGPQTRAKAPPRSRITAPREDSIAKLLQAAVNEHAIVSITNRRGEITYVNEKFCEISKYSKKELLGQDHRIVNSQHHPKSFFRALWRKIAQGQTWQGEIQNRAKDGSYYWVATTIVPFLDRQREPYRYVSIRTDITRQKVIERQISESEKLSKVATELAKIGVWDWNIVTDTLRWDDTMFRIFDLDRDKFSGDYQGWARRLHPDDTAKSTAELNAVIRGKVPVFDTLFRIIVSDGSIRYIKARGIAEFDEDGKATRMVGANWDITADIVELKRVEQELRERTREAEAATVAKSQFLATMSHEVRTPLTSVIGYCEMLLGDKVTAAEQHNAAEAALTSARYLLGVLNNVLDMSKIEADKVTITKAPTNLLDLLNEIAIVERQKIRGKPISFGVIHHFPLPGTISTDPTALKQILYNLVDNAIKFTASGKVSIDVFFERDKDLLRFAVSDSGIGISPKQQERLFKPFSQADSSMTRRFGGSGLGLAISKRLINLLGGNITVQSALGEGSTFTVLLPIDPVAMDTLVFAEQHNSSAPSASNCQLPHCSMKVLLVDDSIEVQTYVKLLLTKMGFEVTAVNTGEEALTATKNAEFCLIIMDMHLPVMDGQVTTRSIRERGLTTPILALSADVRSENIEGCFLAGCTDFLAKPFSREIFGLKLEALLKPCRAGDARVPDDTLENEFGKTIVEFINSFFQRIQELEQAQSARDYTVLAKASHKLAGAAAFAYPAVYETLLGLHGASRKRSRKACEHHIAKLKKIHSKGTTVAGTAQYPGGRS